MNRRHIRIRLIALLSAVGMALLATAGCGIWPGGSQPSAVEEKVTLTFRHFWVGEHDKPVERIFRQVIDEFEAEHSWIKIDFEGLDQTIHREQKLKSEMVTGRPPDIFSLFGGAEIEPYVRAGRLLDLTGFIEERGMKDQFSDLSLWTFDGKVYGLPFEGNAEPLFYNKTMFERLGLSPPRTVDDLMELIPALRRHKIIPFALGNEPQWPAGIYAHYFMDRQVGSKRFESVLKGEASFDNPDYLLALESLYEMAGLGAFPANPNLIDTEEAVDLFTEGKAAMYVNGNWDITLFPQHFMDDVGVIPFPVIRPGDPQALAGGYTVGIGLSSALNESKQEAALAFLAEMYRPDVQRRLMNEAYRIPAMSGLADMQTAGPVFSQVIRLTEQTEAKFVPYDNMLPPEVKQKFLHIVADIVDRRLQPDEGLRNLEQTAQNYWRLRSSR